MKLFKIIVYSGVLLFAGLRAGADLVVTPNNLAEVEGNSVDQVPFDIVNSAGSRYQQVINASEFGAIANGGGMIRVIMFRLDGSVNTELVQHINNFQINMSTTPRNSDSLSPVLVENLGLNDQIVFGPKSVNLFGASGNPGEPALLTIALTLDNYFFYNPEDGNLLIDIRNFSGSSIDTSEFRLDGQNTFGDSISSTLSRFSVDSPTASEVSSFGYVMRFTVDPVPEPSPLAIVTLVAGVVGLLRWRLR